MLLIVNDPSPDAKTPAVVWDPDAGVGWPTLVGSAAARGGWREVDEAPPAGAADSPHVKRLATMKPDPAAGLFAEPGRSTKAPK
jgi:hypothetical protein